MPASAGSSPHARGAQGDVIVVHVPPGIIPACAGSTGCCLCPECSKAGSSPHARGALVPTTWHVGSIRDHPRMRGEHRLRRIVRERDLGIIPACAGSTQPDCMPSLLLEGSSPHARGAPDRGRSRRAGREDHPRMRGEHYQPIDAGALLAGIIPACAGSTSISLTVLPCVPGSSPHARGAQLLRDCQLFVGRIIPACAGSTSSPFTFVLFSPGSSPHARGAPRSRTWRTRPWRDHPRMRGEHCR